MKGVFAYAPFQRHPLLPSPFHVFHFTKRSKNIPLFLLKQVFSDTRWMYIVQAAEGKRPDRMPLLMTKLNPSPPFFLFHTT
jgi:hypothetical protein